MQRPANCSNFSTKINCMKTTVLFLMLSVCSFTGFAQIEMKESRQWTKIGQVKFGGITKASMEYVVDSPGDTSFMFFIKDVREQPKDNYFAIHFKGYNNTFSTFYTVLKSFFIKENQKDRKYEKVFKLGDTNVHVQHH